MAVWIHQHTKQAKIGELVTLHGTGFGSDPQVYLAPCSGNSLAVAQANMWRVPDQYVLSTSANCIVFRIPPLSGIVDSVWAVQVVDTATWSNQRYVNVPEPWQLLDVPGQVFLPGQAAQLKGQALSQNGEDITVRIIPARYYKRSDGITVGSDWRTQGTSRESNFFEWDVIADDAALHTWTLTDATLSGTYEIWLHRMSGASSTNTRHTVTTTGGDVSVSVDQSDELTSDKWVKLGEWTLDSTFKLVVSNVDSGTNTITVGDVLLRRTDSDAGTDVTATPVVCSRIDNKWAGSKLKNVVEFTVPPGLATGNAYEFAVVANINGYTGVHRSPDTWAICLPDDPSNTLKCPPAWRSLYDFYGEVINVKTDVRLTNKATGNPGEYQHVAIQEAIDLGESLGGAVIYFPAGTYPIKEQLRHFDVGKVVFRGDGADLSTIVVDDTLDAGGNRVLSTSYANFVGYEDIGIRVEATAQNLPMNQNFQNSFTYMKDCRFYSERGNGLGYSQRLSIDNCTVIVRSLFEKLIMDGGRAWCCIRNSYWQWSDSMFTQGGTTPNLQLTNNLFIRTVESDGTLNGYRGLAFGRSRLVHIAHNYFGQTSYTGQGGQPITQSNDCETILNEMVPHNGLGSPTAIGANTLTDSGFDFRATSPDDRLGRLGRGTDNWLAIIDGPGYGQIKKIKTVETNVLTLEEDWDELPTTESTYAVSCGIDKWTILDNKLLLNGPRGIMPYGSTWQDSIIGFNQQVNNGEIYLRVDQRAAEWRFNWFANTYIENCTLYQDNDAHPAKAFVQIVVIPDAAGIDYLAGNPVYSVHFRNIDVSCNTPNRNAIGGYFSREGLGVEPGYGNQNNDDADYSLFKSALGVTFENCSTTHADSPAEVGSYCDQNVFLNLSSTENGLITDVADLQDTVHDNLKGTVAPRGANGTVLTSDRDFVVIPVPTDQKTDWQAFRSALILSPKAHSAFTFNEDQEFRYICRHNQNGWESYQRTELAKWRIAISEGELASINALMPAGFTLTRDSNGRIGADVLADAINGYLDGGILAIVQDKTLVYVGV